MSKTLIVPISIELDGIVFSDTWRVPAMTVEEMNFLRNSFIDVFGASTTQQHELFDLTLGTATAVYDWIFNNLKIHDSRISFYYDTNRSGTSAQFLIDAVKIFFPIFNDAKNYYASAVQYSTYTPNTYYRTFNVTATNVFGSTSGISCTMSRPDISDAGYNIFTPSSGGAFFIVTETSRQNNAVIRVPIFVIDADDNIIGVTYSVIWCSPNNLLLRAYTVLDFIVPNTYTPISSLPNSFAEFVAQGHYIVADDDPYSIGGNSGVGGGTGTFTDTGDIISIPALPTLSAVDTNFITLYNPSIAQLRTLASYMWSGLFDLDTFKKIFADPMNAILGLSVVPVNVPSGTVNPVKIGNIDTGVTMTVAASQYVSVDCGTINVPEYWGAYLDFDPYTKIEIYLPYVGIRPMSADCVVGKSVHVVYHVDILSGACTAYVAIGGTVLYTYIGQCSASIPITGDNWTNVINGTLSIAGAIGSAVASGGASAPMAASMIASTAVNSMKPNIQKSGAMSGTGGMLAVQKPYLIVTRPRQALPSAQNHYTGYPAFITKKLGDLSGYTEIEHIHLENIPATGDELTEIENLLKGGVIL